MQDSSGSGKCGNTVIFFAVFKGYMDTQIVINVIDVFKLWLLIHFNCMHYWCGFDFRHYWHESLQRISFKSNKNAARSKAIECLAFKMTSYST